MFIFFRAWFEMYVQHTVLLFQFIQTYTYTQHNLARLGLGRSLSSIPVRGHHMRMKILHHLVAGHRARHDKALLLQFPEDLVRVRLALALLDVVAGGHHGGAAPAKWIVV